MQALIPSSKSFFFPFVALGPFVAHYAPLIEEKKLEMELSLAVNIDKQELEQQEEERSQRRQRAELENNKSSDKQKYVYGIADVLLILSDYEHMLSHKLLLC